MSTMLPWIDVPDYVCTDIARLIEEFTWGCTEQPTSDDWKRAIQDEDRENALCIACGNGHIAIFDWIKNEDNKSGNKRIISTRKVQDALCAAGCNGHEALVKEFFIDRHSANHQTLMKVCKTGNVSMADLMLTSIYPNQLHSIYSTIAFFNACESGNMNMVNWVQTTMGFGEPNTSDLETASKHAAMGGHIDMLKHLSALGANNYKQQFVESCGHGRLPATIWLLEKYPDCIPSESTKAMSSACKHGSLNSIQWLLHSAHIIRFTHDNFISICGSGNLEAVTWCHANTRHLWVPTETAMNDGLNEACRNRKWDTARWIVLKGGADDLTVAVERACKGDNFPFAKWLIEKGGSATGALIHACKTNMDIDTVKWCIREGGDTQAGLFYTQNQEIRKCLVENGARRLQRMSLQELSAADMVYTAPTMETIHIPGGLRLGALGANCHN